MAFLGWLIGCLGLWEPAMQTVALLSVAVGIAVLVGFPVGVLAARSLIARAAINPLLDLMQTIPSFVYLIPAAMLFGLGKVPAILATVVYATPPLIRLTDLGIREVNRAAVEASRAFGATRRQVLTGVELPLALPTIMQGINQTLMMALSMVVIASMIGPAASANRADSSGTGRHRPRRRAGDVLLAVIFDRTTQAVGLTPGASPGAGDGWLDRGPQRLDGLRPRRGERWRWSGRHGTRSSSQNRRGARARRYLALGRALGPRRHGPLRLGQVDLIRHLNRLIGPTEGGITIGTGVLALSIRDLKRFHRGRQ
jgi:glycine betaine/proline transport system permease protein